MQRRRSFLYYLFAISLCRVVWLSAGSAALHKKTTWPYKIKRNGGKLESSVSRFVFSAFGVYYRQLRVDWILQLFAEWKLPIISNLRCNVGEWNVFVQASIGFWNSVFANLGHYFETYISFCLLKTETYCRFAISCFKRPHTVWVELIAIDKS